MILFCPKANNAALEKADADLVSLSVKRTAKKQEK
jgi:hypothetical protein